jgi:hypothetical protein
MDSKNKKLKSSDVDKNNSSLVLNYESENQNAKNDKSTTTPINDEKSVSFDVRKKTKKEKASIEEIEVKVTERLVEFEGQFAAIQEATELIGDKIADTISLLVKVIQKINGRLFGWRQKEEEEVFTQEVEENPTEEVIEEPFSFKQFMDMQIIFTDNKKKPLYNPPKRNESMYTYNDEILNAAIMDKILDIFKETADAMKKDMTPETGFYQKIPLTRVLREVNEEEVYHFLFYVRRYPAKYAGKKYRISESFAGWVMSGTPED